jgi:hypothetical protein
MRFAFAFVLLVSGAFATPDAETETIKIEKVDIGNTHRGQNKFSAAVVNKTDSMLTLVLDLRADGGVWLRKNQRQFVYLLGGKEERQIEAEYQFDHISSEAFLRVRFYFPTVSTTGITKLPKPFFEQRYPVGLDNKEVDYDFSQFRKRESKHFLVYYFPDSLAAHDIDHIADERDRGFEKISDILRLESNQKIRLFLFPDEQSKKSETGHQGAGWAFDNNIVEVYNEKTKLDPFHETAHILSGQLGSPAAMFNEGFAVYVSELLGADALRELGSQGKTCDEAVVEHQGKGNFIPLRRLLSFDDIGPDASQPAISYPEACSVVRFLVNRYGLEKFRQAFASVRADDVNALEKVYGTSIEDIERSWLSNVTASH